VKNIIIFIYANFYIKILKNIDYKKARELIHSKRTSRDSIRFVIHDLIKWNSKLQDLKQKANELIKWLFMKN